MKVKNEFWKFIRFNLGSGQEIKFWEDVWVGESPLKEEFSGLFSLVTGKKATAADSFDFEGSVWNPRFRRNIFYWEIKELFRFFSLLANHNWIGSKRPLGLVY